MFGYMRTVAQGSPVDKPWSLPGVVLSTRGEEVRLGPGAKLKTTLEDAVTIAVPID